MVAWSTLFIGDGNISCSSSDSSLKTPTKCAQTIEDALKCYVCEDYYTKPRILPCGHTYCSGCLLRLREGAINEFNKSRDANAHRRGECGFFTCPWPNCHYSMKIMNVWRWTMRNKAISKAVAIAKKKETQTSSTQTDTQWSDVVLSVPHTLIHPLVIPTDGRTPPATPTETAIEYMAQNSLTTDCCRLPLCRLPGSENGGKKTWRSYLFMVGMVVMDQALKIGTNAVLP